MKETQGNVRKEKTRPTIHKMRLRAICDPERGLDWRGVTYAAVLTTRGGEVGDPRGVGSRARGRDERRLEREGQTTRNGGEVCEWCQVVQHVGFAGAARPSRSRKCSVPRRGYSDSIPYSAVWQMSMLLITTTRLCYIGHPTAEACCLNVVQISMRGTKRDTQLHRVLVRPGHEAGARYSHTIQLLLEHGADVDALDHTQSTLLPVASEYGSAMLECGASVHIQNNGGQTSSQVVSAKGYEEIARSLLEHSQSEQKM